MRNKLGLGLLVGMLALICVLTAAAQDSRLAGVTGAKYLISAKAGGVNLISGTVTVERNDGTAGRLVAGESLDIGDRVTTGDDGRAEVLLNPGSYLRVGANSAFKFVTTDLEDLKIDLSAGTAIFEVIANDDFRVSVKMPKQHVFLTQTGVYRLDVTADGNSRLAVFKGEAFVGPKAQTKVASGRTALLTVNGTSVAKFDRDTKDPFDVWSKERGKNLMKANAQLQQKALRNSLIRRRSITADGICTTRSGFGSLTRCAADGASCPLVTAGTRRTDGDSTPTFGGSICRDMSIARPRMAVQRAAAPAGPINRPIGPTSPRTKIPAFIQMQGGAGASSAGADTTNRRSGDGLINNGGRDGGAIIRSPKQDMPVYRPQPPVMAPSVPTKVDTIKRPGI